MVKALTTGTMTNPISMTNAPQLMGDWRTAGKEARKRILAVMTTVLKIKQHQTLALEVFLEYRLYKSGAKKAPAKAPQEIPINCAIKVTLLLYCKIAITTEIAIKIMMKKRMQNSCFFSFISFMTVVFKKSKVKVELEAKTKLDKVDIEADKTKTMTTAIKISGRSWSMAGMMLS